MFESTCLTLFLYLTDINKIEESKYYCFTTSSRCVAPVTILYKITTLHVLLLYAEQKRHQRLVRSNCLKNSMCASQQATCRSFVAVCTEPTTIFIPGSRLILFGPGPADMVWYTVLHSRFRFGVGRSIWGTRNAIIAYATDLVANKGNAI